MTFKFIPFKQIGITAVQFNGLTHDAARKEAINAAVDWLGINSFWGLKESEFPINYELSDVDWITETVAIKIELKLEN